MTDLTDRIAEVLRRHVSAQTENWETKLRCECGRGDFTSKLEYAAHVAEQITAVRTIDSTADLAQLPNLSVVQFRGDALGERNRIVWQLDEEWFSPGSTESFPTTYFPSEAFPAVVLWVPVQEQP